MSDTRKSWLRYVRFWGPNVDADIDDELRYHIEMRVRDFIAEGLTPEQAHERALELFGNPRKIADRLREHDTRKLRQERRADVVQNLAQDFRYAIRRLTRASRLSITVVLLVGLTLGPVIASFSFVEAMVLRSIGTRTPARTAYVFSSRQLAEGNAWGRGLSFPDFVDLRTALPRELVSAAVAWLPFDGIVETDAASSRVRVTAVSNAYFDVAASRLSAGRIFRDAESPDASEAVISNALWRALGSPAIPAPISVNGQRLTAVGVMDHQSHGINPSNGTDIWIPFGAYPAVTAEEGILRYREVERISVLVELQNESQMSRLAAMVGAFSPTLRPYHEGLRDWRLVAKATTRSAWRSLQTDRASAALLPLYVASCLLIITLGNLANIFAVRAAVRHREVHIQIALGASRARLVYQALLEPLILGAGGGVLGVFSAYLVISLTRRFAFVEALHLAIGPTIAALGVFVAMAASVLLSVIPVRVVLATRGSDVIRQAAGVAARGVSGWQRFFVALQFGLALAMTAVVAQFVDAVRHTNSVEFGFAPQGLLSIAVPPTPTEMSRSDWRARYDRIEGAIRTTPGITAVAGSRSLFDTNSEANWPLTVVPTAKPVRGMAGVAFGRISFVSPGFFRTLRLPLLAGREFSERDGPDGPIRVVVNDAVARLLWPGRSPIGSIAYSNGNLPVEVIGVAGTTTSSTGRAEPGFYFRHDQVPLRGFVLYARLSGADDSGVMRALRSTLASADPTTGRRADLQLVSRQLEAATVVTRSSMWVGIAVGSVSLIIACVGLFGLTSYVVLLRRKELAIRAALGGSPRHLFLLVLREGYKFAALGTLLGIPLAIVGSRLTQWLVVGVGGAPIMAAAGALTVFMIVAFAGTVIPARRTAGITPARVLSEL